MIGEFLKRRRTVLAAILVLAVGLTWLSASLRGESELNPFERGVLWVSHPLLRVADVATGSLRTTWTRYLYLVGVEEENRGLRTIVEGLKADNARLVEASQENQRLRRLLGFKERAPEIRTVAAEVIGVGVEPGQHVLVLDKGSADGIVKDSPVVTASGVVGKVMEVERHVSLVLELTDHRSQIDALVQRSRAKAVVQGRGDDGPTLRFLARRDDVRVGDLIVTSGMGSIFPKGLRIGTVEEVVPASTGLFQGAGLKPAVEFSRLEEVLVLPSLDSVRPASPGAAARPGEG